jgi:hypothetical protein
MATNEFHDRYTEYLDALLKKPLIDGRPRIWDLSEVLETINTIVICKELEEITPEEADKLTSEIFTLYPQFEENIKAELSEH